MHRCAIMFDLVMHGKFQLSHLNFAYLNIISRYMIINLQYKKHACISYHQYMYTLAITKSTLPVRPWRVYTKGSDCERSLFKAMRI